MTIIEVVLSICFVLFFLVWFTLSVALVYSDRKINGHLNSGSLQRIDDYYEKKIKESLNIECLKINKKNIKLIANWVELYECCIVVDRGVLRPTIETSLCTIRSDECTEDDGMWRVPIGEARLGDYLIRQNGRFKIIRAV